MRSEDHLDLRPVLDPLGLGVAVIAARGDYTVISAPIALDDAQPHQHTRDGLVAAKAHTRFEILTGEAGRPGPRTRYLQAIGEEGYEDRSAFHRVVRMDDRVVQNLTDGDVWVEVQLVAAGAACDLDDRVGVALDESHRLLDLVEHRNVVVFAPDNRPALIDSAKHDAPDLRVGKMDGLLSSEQDDPSAGGDKLVTVLRQDAETS